ncbi:MAG: CAMP factor family pore-forming toxin [Lagierella massiliensis]|nr:CAMP factor family pore-forming toxin [Lagierella massiliensis]
MKKIIASALAVVMAFGVIAPTVTLANEVNSNPTIGEERVEVFDVDQYKEKLEDFREEISNLENITEHEEKMKAEFMEKTLELESNIDRMTSERSAYSSIYDLNSIPQRLLLVAKLGVSIRFATTELRYKVEEAHAKIAEYVFQGLMIAASPLCTVDEIKDHMNHFDVLKAELLSYPDITTEDTANIYVRADLDRLLHAARMAKFYELKDKSTQVIKTLDREVLRITGERLKPQATVADIYRLTDELNQAMEEALNSEDFRATKAEIELVKILRIKARQKKRAGDNRIELIEAIENTNEQMLMTRPSQTAIRDLINTFNSLLD